MRRNPFVAACAAWIFTTAAMVSWVRASFGIHQSLSVRYKIYCILLLICCYLYVADRVRSSISISAERKQKLYLCALATIVIFSLSADVLGYRFLKNRRDHIVKGLAFYERNPAVNSPLVYADDHVDIDPQEGLWNRDLLNQVIARHIYTLPPLPEAPQ